MKRKNITAFYVETLILIIAFVAVILLITSVFGKAKTESTNAKVLTSSVCIAENAAEVFSARPDIEGIAGILGKGNVIEKSDTKLVLGYDSDMREDPDGVLNLNIQLSEKNDLSYCDICVINGETGETVYTLKTASGNMKGGDDK